MSPVILRSDQFVSVPNSTDLNITGDITVDAWVYHTNQTGLQNIVSKRDDTNTNVTYEVWTRTDGTLCYSSRLAGTQLEVNTAGNGTIPLNTWTHIAVTQSGTNVQFYINGAP